MKTDREILLSRFNDIKKRCNNKNAENYYLYWWRWIKCEWTSSKEFLEDMTIWFNRNLQIDRIDNDWNYCKSNCRWITNKENCNNRRNNILLTLDWITKTMKQWSEIFNISYQRVMTRVNRNWYSLEDALKTPIKTKYITNFNKSWITH